MRTALIAITAAAALAGCSGGTHGSPSAAHTTAAAPVTSAATASATASPSPAASPSAPVRRMTKKQAARAYVRIIDPGNTLSDAMNRDNTDAAPFSQYKADARAYIKAIRITERQLRAIRWPARVQPYVTAMLLTFEPANIRCVQTGIAAGSNAAAANVNDFNQDCLAASDSTLPDTIRSMLGLPPRS